MIDLEKPVREREIDVLWKPPDIVVIHAARAVQLAPQPAHLVHERVEAVGRPVGQ